MNDVYSTIISLRCMLFSFLLIVSLVVSGLIAQDIIFVYLVILFFSLVAYFVFQGEVNLFNPFTLFTIFYFTIIPASLHLYLFNFQQSIYLEHVNIRTDLNYLLELALLYYIAGYWFALLGYKLFARKQMPAITFKDGISVKLVNICIFVFASVGISNFCYNVFVYAGGNLMVYISNVSIRYLEYEERGGTTLGYLFAYTAAYLWLYKILKLRKVSYLFFPYIGLTICMYATTGRIAYTLFYALSFVSIYYHIQYKRNKTNNLKYILILSFMGCLGLLFYLFRLTSSLSYNNMMDAGWIGTIISFLNFESLMFFVAAKGNIPNVAVFMQIIDSWGSDIGFLYGQTLVTWMFSIIPSSLRPEGYQVSVMIKNIWHAQTPGGNLPPTGVGEMYANFGMLGPFFGMFFFGCLVAGLYNLLFKFNNYWYLVVYSNISLCFVMLYAKGEFDNLSLWDILPMFVTYSFLKFCTLLFTAKTSACAKEHPQIHSPVSALSHDM